MGYNNSIIYKIICKDNNITDFYIGSTINIQTRINRHKSYCLNGKDIKLYNFIRENGGWDNWKYQIIKNYNCNDRNELRIEEQRVINELKSTLNDINSYITDDKRKETAHINYMNRRERVLNDNKIKITCDCGRVINKNEKSPHLKSKIHKQLMGL